jgi:hypothetical protein
MASVNTVHEALRTLAESLPADTPVPVPAGVLLELFGGAPPVRREEDLPTEMTQREAARVLRVSVSFLRASSCPKHLLPGNGPRGSALVRYLRSEVLAWGATRALRPAPRKAS